MSTTSVNSEVRKDDETRSETSISAWRKNRKTLHKSWSLLFLVHCSVHVQHLNIHIDRDVHRHQYSDISAHDVHLSRAAFLRPENK